MKPIPPILSLVAFWGMASAEVVDENKDQRSGPQDAEVKATDTEVPEVYIGKMPDNDQLKVTEEHKVIATFQGIHEAKSV
ncbi:MAG: hypothetical protein ACPG4K_13915, partial [Haloferula sp.]